MMQGELRTEEVRQRTVNTLVFANAGGAVSSGDSCFAFLERPA
jgi:hypothetical protein